jgi:deoxycytidine triphosphate deaminase
MLNNAQQVADLLQTNGKGAKAQVGYDLTLKEVKIVNGGSVMSDKTNVTNYSDKASQTNKDGREVYEFAPGTYSLTFEQGIKLPSNKTAFIVHRSSVLRCGGVITSGIYDPGFEVDEMGAMLIVTEPLIIEKGARVAQVYIFENNYAEAYDGQWMGTKDVK